MTEQRYVVRGRGAGKTNEMATGIAKRCGLTHATVMDLLQHGWTYTETLVDLGRWTKEL